MSKRKAQQHDDELMERLHDAALRAREGFAVVLPTKTVTWARFVTENDAWSWAEWNYGRTSLQLVAEGFEISWQVGKRT